MDGRRDAVSQRLPAHVEAKALMRRIEAGGGFATLIAKGDPDRGSLLLQISEKGRYVCYLERQLTVSGTYQWVRCGPAAESEIAEIRDFYLKRRRFDEDIWAIELDIADAERFIAESTQSV